MRAVNNLTMKYCKFCGGEMSSISALAYKSNQYCNNCFEARAKKAEILANVKEKMCDKHRPVNLPFLEWQDYAMDNYDSGIVQSKCNDCGYWLFPEEY